jgi:hypothetical protein
MSSKVLQIQKLLAQDDPANFITNTWNNFNSQRQDKIKEWLELRNYIFATDTRSTSNSALPWKNSTTTPKLCQIRDNLHSNYISALFPNDQWLSWQAFTKDAAKHKVARIIEGYMENKCRESHFRTEMSKMVYDYIDYGNAFSTVTYESEYKIGPDGTRIAGYVGPRIHRISPLDIVFDPMAESIHKTFKIVRSIKTLGEIQRLARDEPEQAFWADALAKRKELISMLGGYSYEDFQKACGYSVDGFGNMYEYLMGNYMEILEFYGDYCDNEGNLETDRIITVTDRKNTVRNEQIPTWFGGAPINHVGWRFRQDNLWAMGPLDNLVGMQYRIDHLENAKADAWDLMIQPPLKIIGTVEEFNWAPSSEVYCAEGGDVAPIQGNWNALISTNNEISELEDKMELYAGAPRDAMGIRTPGEKTAFEVNQLMTAAGRIFQEKATQIEVELLEPTLNMMLESAKRNLSGADIIRVIDNDLNVQQFLTVTKEDITAAGIIRPVGARHFSKQQQDLQNLVGIFNSPIGQMIMPHTSAINMANLVSDIVGVRGYELFRTNVGIEEQQETQAAINQGQEDLAVQQRVQIPPGVA